MLNPQQTYMLEEDIVLGYMVEWDMDITLHGIPPITTLTTTLIILLGTILTISIAVLAGDMVTRIGVITDTTGPIAEITVGTSLTPMRDKAHMEEPIQALDQTDTLDHPEEAETLPALAKQHP